MDGSMDGSFSHVELWGAARPAFHSDSHVRSQHLRIAHRVLLVPELVSCILEHADTLSLTCFARTCKGFLVPSLTVLYSCITWTDFKSISDLTIFAPLYESEFTDDDVDMRRKKARQILDKLDPLDRWRRFLTYTSFVRVLEDKRYGTRDIDDDDEVFQQYLPGLFQLSPVPCVLPQLRAIHWRVTLPGHMECIVPLLSASVQDLNIHYDVPGREHACHLDDVMPMRYVLQLLPTRCPQLRRLWIDSNDFTFTSTIASTLAFAMARLRHLKKVSCGSIALKLPVMQALLRQSGLEELSVYSWYGSGEIELPLDVFYGSCRLSSLRMLALEGLKTGALVKFLEFLGAELEWLHIRVRATNTLAEGVLLERLCTVIAQRFSNVTNLGITINEVDGPEDRRTETVVSATGSSTPLAPHLYWSTFMPLTECRHIRDFTFLYGGKVYVHIGDDDILQVARSWNELEELIFYGDVPESREGDAELPDTTLASLISLSDNCPRLKIVQLNTLRISPTPELSSITPRMDPMIVHFASDPVSDISNADLDDLAIALIILWPNIKFGGGADEGWDALKEKLDLLKAYAAQR